MTLPPSRLGDRDQRYQVSILGYPNDGWNVVAWSGVWSGAQSIGASLLRAPGAKTMRIENRKTGETWTWERER